MKHQNMYGTVTIQKRSTVEWIYDIFCRIFVILFAIICVYPFYYIAIYSISDPTLVKRGIFLLPKGFSLVTYASIFARGDILKALTISTLRTVIGTAITIMCTFFLSFLVTRKEMWGRKFIYRYAVLTMYFSAGLLPWYITMKLYNLDNTFLLYVIPGAINAYYMILMKTYIEQIPDSLEEAAEMEGAGLIALLFKIIMPLSKPIIATCVVYCAVGQWNSWQDNFFLVSNKNLTTLQLILQNYINESDKIAKLIQSANNAGSMSSAANAAKAVSSQSIRMTVIMMVTLPVMLVYPFAQKYFTKGIMMGAVKG